VDIPVRCISCGATGTTSRLIGGDGSGAITLENVTLGAACPVCGGDMKPPDATYEFENGILKTLRLLDRSTLQQVQGILQDASEQKLSAEAATAQVLEQAPQLEGVLTQLPKQATIWIPILLQVITVVLAWMALQRTDGLTTADNAELQHDIRAAIEQVHHDYMPTVKTKLPPSKESKPRSKRQKRPKTYGQQKKKKRKR
jgi:hypothetical protein